MAEGGTSGNCVGNQSATSGDGDNYSLPFDIASVEISYPQLLSFFASETKDSTSPKIGSSLDTDTVDAEALKGGGFRLKSELYEFKRQQQEERRSDSWSWKALSEFIKAQVPASGHSEVNAILKKFCDTSKELLGKEVDTAQIQAGVVYLVKTLRGTKYVSNEQKQQLRLYFGEYSDNPINRASNLIEELEKIATIGIIKWSELDSPPKDKDLLDKPFGSAISLNAFPGLTPKVKCNLDDLVPNGMLASANDEQFFHSYQWLVSQVKQRFPMSDLSSIGMSSSDMCSAIMQLLKSVKATDDLQSDLVELVGLDRVDLVGEILTHRDAIVLTEDDYKIKDDDKSKSKMRQTILSDPTVLRKLLPKPTHVSGAGCQIVVQSEEEKEMRKHVRKEEKKFRKAVGNSFDTMEDSAKSFASSQMKLAMAQTKPTLRDPTVDTSAVRYPHVYDLRLEIAQKAALFGSARIMLPKDTKYESDKIKEEVHIPPSKQPPTEIGKDRVKVSSLPSFAQKAFQGFKELNLIQSVVHKAALFSADNLLISAPTGAGKTNIALLTILHEVGQHVRSDGSLEDKDFKIIYVAPMKALAAEMTENFGKRLAPLGLTVKELTGDMQLSKSEIMKTQMLVTTPEKWDVVTRKGTGDLSLVQSVKLLIIDEVHLLHEDRGSVIETLVARTLRQIESTQSRIRLVALSATLPNYLDVARFLRVDPYKGLFYFDGRFRPVPLSQTFIGIKAINIMQQMIDLDDVCYEKVKNVIERGYQCMVFVHSRSGTVKTAQALKERATHRNEQSMFLAETWKPEYISARKEFERSRNKELKELFGYGFSVHHAGMLRQDRNIVERNFAKGHIRVLVCTATLAWGVNLPAHAVVIKGTQYYDAQKSSFVDIGILDVLQIFGRAGRPQYDTFGEAYILTTYSKLSHYLNLLTRQTPIESQYVESLTDHLNAEIVLGTVNSIDEAIQWLSYTYLLIRMKANPLAYGVNYTEYMKDPNLINHRRELIVHAAKQLDDAKMTRYIESTGYLYPTDLGRTASHYYINFHTIVLVNEHMNGNVFETEILKIISMAEEFQQVKVRDEELDELSQLMHDCWYDCSGGAENNHGKVNILLQSYVNRIRISSFSLTSDQLYVSTNASRIARALFEIALKNNWANAASRLLSICKCTEQRLWEQQHPLRQLPADLIKEELLQKLERSNLSLERLLDMPANEISSLLRLNPTQGKRIKELARSLPAIKVEATVQPITRTVLRVKVSIYPMFTWIDKVSGPSSEPWWLWVEDPESNYIYHNEFVTLSKKQVVKRNASTADPHEVVFTIPIHEPLPTQYLLRVESDRWVGCGVQTALSFRHLILPEQHPPHTELLDLDPIPKSALGNKQWEDLFTFSHFNPIQTQIFHTMYYTDVNVLLGAPTGSGKTISAEIAFFKVFRDYPGMKVVYIAPLKALVRERVKDWKVRLEQRLGKFVVELTGDVVPDSQAIASADVIVTTPEKWDGVSRSWQTRQFVRSVALIVIDEIHLLGDDRGPVLEVIVSRTNFISSNTDKKVRVIGLSTALANARDLADWLGIKTQGLFNFKPSVRPVPLEIHIAGFAGRHYCPRMASMNKPAYQQIRTHSPNKPVLIFVSSRRQTRLTALDLVAFLVSENAKQWLHCSQEELDGYLSMVKETNLKLLLAFGIGIHHAGLTETDRNIVEEMFVNQKIQVLIATATLAWGVNFPAHLVIVKGTEYYDGKSKKYQLMPITDVLQMIGRAGRPQFDNTGKAVVFVHDVQKNFYKKFLYEPFPVESSLLAVLPEHLNAEIIAGTINSKQDAIEYVTWTYFFRRLLMNPAFYGLSGTDQSEVNLFLSNLIEKSVNELCTSNCVAVGEDEMQLEPQVLGRIASYYYVSHMTVRLFSEKATPDATIADILKLLTDACEYNELPVRHNEELLNADLAKLVPLEVNPYMLDDPHVKAFLLFQAHFTGAALPCTDYLTDTKSVLDQSIRILQALLDCVADRGWLNFSLRIMQLIQMIVQGMWITQSPFLQLPHLDNFLIGYLRKNYSRNPSQSNFNYGRSLPELMTFAKENPRELRDMMQNQLKTHESEKFLKGLEMLPIMKVSLSVSGFWQESTAVRVAKNVPIVDPSTKNLKNPKLWVDVHGDQEYLVEISIRKLNRCPRNAHAPKFPKPKPAGWFLVLGDIEQKELLAMKRLTSLRPNQTLSLSFYTPENPGKVIYYLYLMSDSYIGLDQQYAIHLNVIEQCVQTQLQTEINDLDLMSSDEEDCPN